MLSRNPGKDHTRHPQTVMAFCKDFFFLTLFWNNYRFTCSCKKQPRDLIYPLPNEWEFLFLYMFRYKFFVGYMICKYFRSICNLFYSFTESWWDPIYSFFPLLIVFFISSLKNSSLSPSFWRFSSKFLPTGFIVSHFTFKSVIHFELIFIKMWGV